MFKARSQDVIRPDWKAIAGRGMIPPMKKSDITCPTCQAGYRRIELTSRPGVKGEYRCLLCNEVLEKLDGSTDVAIRLTVQPERTFETQPKSL
jgi:DNA-directed RNA polymerase subunit RPC12/RpoP